jgi:DNA-directed RNA polymerase specialized sigma24 family protein
MDEAAIETELVAAQAAVDSAKQARIRRQEAVVAARDAGWSKYRIAQVLGVKGPTVDSILKAAESEDTSR